MEDNLNPRNPMRIAPMAAYLASARCPMNGQFLSVRGGTVTLLRNWSQNGQVQREDRYWSIDELAPALETQPRRDVTAELMAALE